MDSVSINKTLSKTIKLEDAMRTAVHVSNEVDLKTAVQQDKLVIISSDSRLYAKMLEKFPMEKVSKKVSGVGKAVAGAGVLLTVTTGGILGVPLIGYGLLSHAIGNVADNYKNYTIRMDYDKKQVQFIKTKGKPHVKL